MGRKKAKHPARITAKLIEIRKRLDLTQEEMAATLIKGGAEIHPGYVGSYEIGERIPTLLVVLAYAKVAKVSTDCLIDDEREL